ncbi:pyruvate dehydrogenase (acetyl-transferring) E1 component subunit alpha [Lentibacillus daqui]|uniref:pyruvate dehydrogenase (acetyl-transferring) E1 component subunit alpha n=1 Tax=Lentibacillus daqui TaxID=2911514 RepID=UPI0022B10B65|nr:pyruvate dehydrogenase (acetyl-transferring) E1 component subunit alpha [Lentibacillus daqui]
MFEENQLAFDRVQLLNEEGKINNPSSDMPISNDTMLHMYKWMKKARLMDEKLLRMQRQGRIGTYAPLSGQEAAQVGSAFALEKSDWLCPSYRDLAACMVHGMPFDQVLRYVKGHLYGSRNAEGLRMLPIQIIIAAQTLHAVGTAFAAKLKHEHTVSVSYFGDGATSQGDFHEALNFASVYQLPVVFFCQNNHYAISVPRKQQTASNTIAQKAIAYGIKGVQVDGNDLVGVYQVMKEAVQRARNDEGPTLIEAETYRLGPHTTSDDPNKYRSKEEVQQWMEKRDPIIRVKKYLISNQLWNEDEEQSLVASLQQEMDIEIDQVEKEPTPSLAEAFDYVYATKSNQLVEQQKYVTTFSQDKGGDLHG